MDYEVGVLAREFAPIVKSFVDRATAPLLARIEQLEARKPEKGDPGEPGKSVDRTDLGAMIHERLSECIPAFLATIPPAKDGKDGADGKDADPESIRALVQEAVAGLPLPEKGDPGEKGESGKDADADVIAASVLEKVMAEVKAIPVPTNGKDGQDGIDGKDGVGLAGAVIDRDNALVVTLTDGTQRSLGVVVGKDGENGKAGQDGRDGLGFDDCVVEFDGERAFKFVLSKGEARKEFGPFVVPAMIDRGVYKEGTEYTRGDCVSFGGSIWVAQESTADKPETTKAWRLGVKRGRDGKDGVVKTVPPIGPVKVT